MEILAARGIELNQCDEPNEMVTPTGAALLAEFVSEFGPMAAFKPDKVGYGFGTREFKSRPNMLRVMLGETQSGEPASEALLGAALPANGPRQHYLRAISTWRADGERVVHPLPSQDSSLVSALARADCLVVLPPGAEALREGVRVPIIPLTD